MTIFYVNAYEGERQATFTSPLAQELKKLFATTPYQELLGTLTKERTTRACSALGRSGYPLEQLFKAVTASHYQGFESTADIVRHLRQDNVLASTCGFVPDPDPEKNPDGNVFKIPSRSAFSGFIEKMRRHQPLLDACVNKMASELETLLPGYGDVVVVDSTPVKTHSRGPRRKYPAAIYEAYKDNCCSNYTARDIDKEFPSEVRRVASMSLPGGGDEFDRIVTDYIDKSCSDPEAWWIVKGADEEHKKFTFGYNLYGIIDAKYKLPIFSKLTRPKEVSDVECLLPLVEQATEVLPWLRSKFNVLVSDGGFDSRKNFNGIVKDYHADPVMPLTALGSGTSQEITGTPAKPVCSAGFDLICRGLDKSSGLVKYQCPERAGQIKCKLPNKCSLGNPDKQRILWLQPGHDYRQFGWRIKRGTAEWEKEMRKQPVVERVWSRLKKSRRLEHHCFRYFDRVNTHCTLSVLTMLAWALGEAKAGRIDRVRVSAMQIA